MVAQASGTPSSPTQAIGGPIRVPPLAPDKVNEYASLFEKSGAENGMLNGVIAKQIFERARLPNEVLGRIWNLADTQARGSLDTTEFVIAMHLLASYKSGVMRGLPNTLPPGLYEAAARRGGPRTSGGPRPGPPPVVPAAISPQFSGQGRPQSPPTRQFGQPMSNQSTGDGWVVNPADKAKFDQIFAGVDKANQGFITGDQAVEFFSNSRLPEEILASIWDLADINGEGRLNKDQFAVAMYLIRQQRGTKDGRGALPTTLPPALVPPSMRRQNIQPTQPTAPVFDNAPNITQPKSAADDLFGLDAFSSSPPAQQAPQSTGGSAVPFQAPSSPAPATQPTASTTFKPFIPSSSFGQSIIPQSTGSPAPTSQTRGPPTASDDLLGDGDPEVSNKLTQETTELANLSNQVGNLSKQMQDVHSNRSVTDQQLSQSAQQKREFETRLSQLRIAYEQEVKDVKALEERLTTSRNETRKLQQELAMIDGSYQDLKSQHQQLSTQVETEQRESASLKEKLRQINAELSTLRPAVEKLKSDARQQKGLNAINRKQLATVESDKERLQGEHATATKELEEARKEAETTAAAPSPAVTSPPAVASPAASVTSQNNPFFRRQNTGMSDSGMASPAAPRAVDPRNTFDSVFGPSVVSSATPPPTTSFRSETPTPAIPTGVVEPSPNVSPPPSTYNDSPRVVDPPAPPASRQITSSALPFQQKLERQDSLSSSVKVAPPASRMGAGDTPRIGTPSASVTGEHSQAGSSPVEIERSDIEGSSSAYFDGPTPPAISVSHTAPREQIATPAGEIPGAFPAATPLETPAASRQPSEKKPENENFDDFFGSAAPSQSQKATDFDQAFADMRANEPKTNGSAATPSNKEFPPIREIDDDDDEDEDSEEEEDRNMGFDDNFAPNSLQHQNPREIPSISQPAASEQGGPSGRGALPAADAQSSPPGYNEAVTERPDGFPRQYSGLLPHREDPTSPTGPSHSVDSATGAPVDRSTFQPYGPESTQSPSQSIKSPPPAASSVRSPPANNFDFDSAFASMNVQSTHPAEEEDEEEDDFEDSFATTHHNADAEFDPSFESPVASSNNKALAPGSAAAAPAGLPQQKPSSSAFDDFDNFGTSLPSSSQQNPTSAAPAPTAGGQQQHDWDAIFASLDGPTAQTTLGNPPAAFPEPSSTNNIASQSASTTKQPSTQTTSLNSPTRPELGRALTAGTEHDDPILKRLTGMGYPREESLRALEKFDYNLDKVRMTSCRSQDVRYLREE